MGVVGFVPASSDSVLSGTAIVAAASVGVLQKNHSLALFTDSEYFVVVVEAVVGASVDDVVVVVEASSGLGTALRVLSASSEALPCKEKLQVQPS